MYDRMSPIEKRLLGPLPRGTHNLDERHAFPEFEDAVRAAAGDETKRRPAQAQAWGAQA